MVKITPIITPIAAIIAEIDGISNIFHLGDRLEEMRIKMKSQKRMPTRNELKNHCFFFDEEINRMSHTPLSREEIGKLTTARIKWFEKWFGD